MSKQREAEEGSSLRFVPFTIDPETMGPVSYIKTDAGTVVVEIRTGARQSVGAFLQPSKEILNQYPDTKWFNDKLFLAIFENSASDSALNYRDRVAAAYWNYVDGKPVSDFGFPSLFAVEDGPRNLVFVLGSAYDVLHQGNKQ